MKYRTRINYTAADKALMWDRWQQGDSLEAIAQLFDRTHGSVAGILARSGGVAECLFGHGVEDLDDTFRVDRDDSAGGVLHYPGKAGLACLKHTLCCPPVRKVNVGKLYCTLARPLQITDALKDFRRDLRDSFFVEMFGYESAEKIFAETTHESQVAPRRATAKIIERQPQKL
jgi:hypothetical protein